MKKPRNSNWTYPLTVAITVLLLGLTRALELGPALWTTGFLLFATVLTWIFTIESE